MGNDSPAFNGHLSPQCPESLDMLVNGPAADIASPWKGNLRTLILAQKGSYEIVRSTYPADILIIHRYLAYIASIYLYSVSVNPVNPCTDFLNRL